MGGKPLVEQSVIIADRVLRRPDYLPNASVCSRCRRGTCQDCHALIDPVPRRGTSSLASGDLDDASVAAFALPAGARTLAGGCAHHRPAGQLAQGTAGDPRPGEHPPRWRAQGAGQPEPQQLGRGEGRADRRRVPSPARLRAIPQQPFAVRAEPHPQAHTQAQGPVACRPAAWRRRPGRPRRTAAGARRPAGQPERAGARRCAAGAGGAQGQPALHAPGAVVRADHPAAGRQRRRGRHRTGQPAPGATPHGTDPDRKAGRFPGRRGCDGNGPGRHPRLHRGRAAHRRTLGQGAAEAARRPPPGAGQSRRHGLVRAPRCQHPARDHRPLPRRLPRAGRPGRGFPARLPARLQGPQPPSARRTASAWKRSVHCCSATRGRAAWTGWRWRRWPTRSRI